MCGADQPGTSGSLHESCSERCEKDRELSLISARGKHALDSKDTRCEGSTLESRVRGCILLSCLSLAEIRDYTGKH